MDIYEYLKLDHKRASQLFSQFEKVESSIRKQQIVEFLAQELTVHADAEQATFYKVLDQFETSKEEAEHGKKEHQDIKDQLLTVLNSKEKGSRWEKQVNKLKETVEHHVNEEEGKIFRKAKRVLSEDDAYEIKEKMHYLKQQLLLKMEKKVTKK
jgi:hemerythrin superfamily protein